MDTFVADQNLSRFRNRIECGAEPVTRATLLKLLVEQENMLGLTHEQLRRIDQQIDHLRQMIAIQVEIIEKMNRTAMDTRRADLVLTSMNDLMATYQVHRQKIAAGTLLAQQGPPCLIARQVAKFLPGAVFHDKAGVQFFDGDRKRGSGI